MPLTSQTDPGVLRLQLERALRERDEALDQALAWEQRYVKIVRENDELLERIEILMEGQDRD